MPLLKEDDWNCKLQANPVATVHIWLFAGKTVATGTATLSTSVLEDNSSLALKELDVSTVSVLHACACKHNKGLRDKANG